jgi:DNA polymerase-1
LSKILVTTDNFGETYDILKAEEYIGLDTETFGLKIYDDMFCLQLSTDGYQFYFNFLEYPSNPFVWDKKELLADLADLWRDKNKTWFIHNAKFDLHRFYNHAWYIRGRIHCTQAVARIIYNQHISYSLDACVQRAFKEKKDDGVEKWIKANKAYTWETIEGKKKRIKNKHYDQVPFDIMFDYGCSDVELVRKLGVWQLDKMPPDYQEVYERECKLVKTCMDMEQEGIKIDKEYVAYAKEEEKRLLAKAKESATEQANEEYKNGPKWLSAAFDRVGQQYRINPQTGNPMFDKDELAGMDSPLARTVREIRTREKYIGTYYSSFQHFGGVGGIVHANIRQSGTDTGRFSYSDPNLQNVPKEEDFKRGTVQVRKCFVPREGHCFVMIDFDQQEFRLMLDYAGETSLIRKIMEHGEDVHQATADMLGVSRKEAKTLNFGLLYGMGYAKLSNQLSISPAEAKELRRLYFARLPHVQKFINGVVSKAESRGYIKTWAGRRLYFPDSEYAYKAPNHLIQGGCGDIAREAMNRLSDLLAGYNTNMLVQVHDELLFEVPFDELELVDDLRKEMEDVYVPHNGMQLTCGVEHSWVSWGKQDVEDGKPRIYISEEGTPRVKIAGELVCIHEGSEIYSRSS